MAAPTGNTNAKKGKVWSDALRKALIQGKSLDKIAKKVIKMAEDGDMQAIKEVGERMDGKATQIIGQDEDMPFVATITIKPLDASD